ncbi:hypothetical protein FN846DRAFT_932830 [Sphaerosporella brunnea]|uniref:Uncharacterized protein n=1 Tax=Sphaerosporella brunnea TaxID=1250544 RepID=A0A5J5F7D3_9PEZI|nr:hypothetical protein FN846DRAFT_932830 [Sphaerosporella brunnea]
MLFLRQTIGGTFGIVLVHLLRESEAQEHHITRASKPARGRRAALTGRRALHCTGDCCAARLGVSSNGFWTRPPH